MGTDIHMAIEIRQPDGTWRWEKNATACKWCSGSKVAHGHPCYCTERDSTTLPGRAHGYKGRNYDVFGVLANVRNGTWGEPTPFIAEPRGLPDDMDPELARGQGDDEDAAYSLGDHSFTHVTLAELLAFDWRQPLKRSAIIDWKEFVAWDRKTPPQSYCAGAGRVIRQATAEDMVRAEVEPASWCNVQVSWVEAIEDAAGDFHLKFIPELVGLAVAKNVEKDGVRIVFGFDS